MKKIKIALISGAIYSCNEGEKEKRLFGVTARLAKKKKKIKLNNKNE